MTRTSRFALAALAVLTSFGSAFGHDFWIEPSTFRPAANARLTLDLKVGEKFVGESVARNDARIVRFVGVQTGLDGVMKEEAITGVDGALPAGNARVKAPGLAWFGYCSNPTAIEIEAEKFEKYLSFEGLDGALAERRQRGESAKKGLEIYSRCVKSLVLVDPANAGAPEKLTGWDRRLGFPLELVPLVNPYALKVGDELPLTLYSQDTPLAAALVGCMAKDAPERDVRLRTDDKGRVAFKIERAGVHMIRVVHMVRADPASGSDWESRWASITFEVAPSAVAK